MAKDKHYVQVTLNDEEYELLRWFAYQSNMTINRLLKVKAIQAANRKKRKTE